MIGWFMKWIPAALGGASVSAMLFLGVEMRFLQCSMIMFTYYLTQMPRVVHDFSSGHADLFRFAFASATPFLYLLLNRFTFILTAYRQLVYCSGLLYCIVEAWTIVYLGERLSDWLRLSLLEAEKDDEERSAFMMKTGILLGTLCLYTISAIVWHTTFPNDKSGHTIYWIAGITIIISAALSLVDENGVITEAAIASSLATYGVWTTLDGDAMFRPATLLAVGVVVMTASASLVFDNDSDDHDNSPEAASPSYMIELSPFVKSGFVLLCTNMLATFAGYLNDSWYYFRMVEVGAIPFIYAGLLYKKHIDQSDT
jgi:hypothetical protein